MRRPLQFCLMVVMLLGLGNRAWSKAVVGSQVAAWNVTESRAWGGSVLAPSQRSAAGQTAAWGGDLAWTARRQSTPTIAAPVVPQLRSAPFASCRHDPPPSPPPNTSANPALTVTDGFNLYAYCDGDPVNKWLSRDPIGEKGGINLYGMVRNDPVNKLDYLGLWNPIEGAVVEIIDRLTNPGVIWSPAPCPGKDVETRFIQVFWYNTTPKATGGTVDNGSEGNWQSPPGFHVPTDPTQSWYPQENAGDPFTDNPKGLFNVYTTFEVCRACYCPSAKCAKSVGPCRKWRRYDSGDITYSPGSETPSAGWWEAVKRKWPNLICK